jgi:hypothetical protein
MKQISKRLFGIFLVIIMVVSMAPNNVFKASATTATQSTITTGDIITYGSYPQTKVTDNALITALKAQTLQSDNTVTYGGAKYKWVYFSKYASYYGGTTTNLDYTYQDDNGYYINTAYWFKYEPLQWRVLSNTNGELFVMANKILDSRAYNQVNTNVTWETCTMRTWLNNDFYKTAFNSTEQARIETSTVMNANNLWYGTNGGNSTNDKLFLLSYSEVMNPEYGFDSIFSANDTARMAQSSDFAKSNGLYVDNETFINPLAQSIWWLRSPGKNPYYAGVGCIGGFVDIGDYYIILEPAVGIRPAFRINLSAISTSSITLSKTSASLLAGKTLQLSATILPTNATNKAVSWSTSNTSIATVSSTGLVTVKAVGKATITCTAKDGSGKKATCVTTVIPKTPTSVKAARASSTSVKVSWAAVTGATGYVVYRYNPATKTYANIKTVTAASYINTGLKKGVTYIYKVRSYKTVSGVNIYSGYSAAASAKTY